MIYITSFASCPNPLCRKLFTGILRVQAGIQDISVNAVLNAVVTMPFETEQIGNIKHWVDDMRPPALMDHFIPDQYYRNVSDKPDNVTDLFLNARNDLIRGVPDCNTNREPLVLITTARANFKSREATRIYHQALGTNATVMFLIGHTHTGEDVNVTDKVNAEIAMFNDFVIGGYDDTYDNLNMKVSAIV